MSKITSLILYYNRPQNIERWIAGIKKQTVPSEIWVWDNSNNFPDEYKKELEIYIASDRNFNCQPRVLMGGLVKSPYIYNQDDDLAINDTFLFEKFLEHSEKYPDYAIGWNGRIFSKDINWDKAYQSPGKGFVDFLPADDPISIDMINYGVSFLPTPLINQMPINPFHATPSVTEEEMKFGDDIYNSYWLKKKRVMPFDLKEHYDWLDEDNSIALSKQPVHMDVRNKVARDLFKDKYCG